MRRLLLAAFALVASDAVAAHPVEGEWAAPDNGARMRIAPCASAPAQMCGTLTYIKPRPATAPPPRSKDGKVFDQKSLIGQPLIVGLKPASGTKWKGGKIRFPGSDTTINASVEMNKDGTLKLSGCVAILCGGQTWTRVA